MEPTCTLPRFNALGDAVSWPWLIPVPDTPTTCVVEVVLVLTLPLLRRPFAFLLTTVTLATKETEPWLIPPETGAKLTVKGAASEGCNVNGRVRPLRVKPVPLMLACVIVTSEPPVLVTAADCRWVWPTITLPKLMLEGFTVSCPALVELPDTVKLVEVVVLASASVTVPLDVP